MIRNNVVRRSDMRVSVVSGRRFREEKNYFLNKKMKLFLLLFYLLLDFVFLIFWLWDIDKRMQKLRPRLELLWVKIFDGIFQTLPIGIQLSKGL